MQTNKELELFLCWCSDVGVGLTFGVPACLCGVCVIMVFKDFFGWKSLVFQHESPANNTKILAHDHGASDPVCDRIF
jgi:hypothetical protein